MVSGIQPQKKNKTLTKLITKPFVRVSFMELLIGIEPMTSSLPRMCSTD